MILLFFFWQTALTWVCRGTGGAGLAGLDIFITSAIDLIDHINHYTYSSVHEINDMPYHPVDQNRTA